MIPGKNVTDDKTRLRNLEIMAARLDRRHVDIRPILKELGRRKVKAVRAPLVLRRELPGERLVGTGRKGEVAGGTGIDAPKGETLIDYYRRRLERRSIRDRLAALYRPNTL